MTAATYSSWRICRFFVALGLCVFSTVATLCAENFDGEWAAVEKCSASKFNAKALPGYAAPILVTVRNGTVVGRRKLARRPGFEDLRGDFRSDKPTIKAHGKFDGDTEEWAFDTEYTGRIFGQDKIVFTGTMLRKIPGLGRRAPVRDCELTLTRMGPPGQPTQAVAAQSASETALKPDSLAETKATQPSMGASGQAVGMPPAGFGRRVALVIGNSAYRNVTPLDNPANDARLLADTLRGLDFTLVGGDALRDLDKAGLDRAVQTFGTELEGADVGLFYFAGHGVQVRGANYLVPIDSNPAREADVDFQMLDAALVLRQMEAAGTRLNLVILDACRNNPFGGRGLRAIDRGLAQMRAPEGTLISFATQPGNVARDGADGNSPYTKALAQTIRRPGLGLFDTFNEVGLAVQRATGGAQQPWVSSSPIAGTFYFSQPRAVR
jgi:hypothetical protein